MEQKKINFRTDVRPEDMEAISEIVVSTGFFYDFEIPVAVELAEARLIEGESSGYYFIFAEVDGKTVAYSCFGPIAMTQGGFDLYWIVTHNDYRAMGIGKILLEETHKATKALGGRYIIAETSSLEKYTPTRQFYIKNNYSKEAEIADFYKVGDGKVIYLKRL
jgi:ribosomal protein S18 acetylase RimI-like enzyme